MSQPRRPPTGPGGYELSAAHRRVLTSNRTFLVEKLDPYALIDRLIRRKVVAQQDRGLVGNASSREEAVRNLLNMLTRRGPNALSEFIACSLETGQREVGEKLCADAPDIVVERPPSPLPAAKTQESHWEAKEDFMSVEESLHILKFHPKEEAARQLSLAIPTLIVSFARYDSATGRRPLSENPILVEKLEGAFSADPCFESLPPVEDWPAEDISEGVRFFADNCYDADAALIVVLGYATSDLQCLYACNNELVPIKNVLLDPVVSATALMDKPKIFLFCLTVEDLFRREKTYGFASDDVKIFLQRQGEDFVGELSRMLHSDVEPGTTSLNRLEELCRERCVRL